MVFAVRDLMRDAYPELNETRGASVEDVLAEETRFAHTLDLGLEKLESDRSISSSRHFDAMSDMRRLGKIAEAGTIGVAERGQLSSQFPGEMHSSFMTLRHATRFHAGCCPRSRHRFRSSWLRRAMDEQRDPRSRILERRSQADRQSCLPATSEIRIRRLSPDSLRQLRSSGHHPQRPGRANSSPAKKAKSSSTTRRSMPSPADRSATADGSTPTITTPSSPK